MSLPHSLFAPSLRGQFVCSKHRVLRADQINVWLRFSPGVLQRRVESTSVPWPDPSQPSLPSLKASEKSSGSPGSLILIWIQLIESFSVQLFLNCPHSLSLLLKHLRISHGTGPRLFDFPHHLSELRHQHSPTAPHCSHAQQDRRPEDGC